MKRGTMLVVVLLVFAVLAGGTWALRARQGVSFLPVLSPREAPLRAPEGIRVRVEVINTTGTRGLARRATRVLRDLGYDVVEMGNGGPAIDTTQVLARSGHPDWADAIANALGPAARSEARPDSSRYLDVTVLLGRTWRPPAQPLDP